MADEPTVADTVRRAAKLLRERATAAHGGAWTVTELPPGDGASAAWWVDTELHLADSTEYFTVAEVLWCRADAEFIAAVRPVVVLAVADCWEHQADDMADHEAYETAGALMVPVVRTEDHGTHHDWTATLAAARALLGASKEDGR